MAGNIKQRITLEGYFSAGEIPREEHFADLISSSINQNEDGIQKSVTDPLKIQAGTPGDAEEVLRFYDNLQGEAKWVISQNPQKVPLVGNDAAGTRNRGLDFSQGSDNSHFFIQEGGRIGIGTTAPTAKLEIKGEDGGSYKFGGSNRALEGGNSGGNMHIDSTPGSLYLNHYSNKDTYINASGGKVGIATDNPQDLLQVSNFASSDNYITVTAAGGNRYRAGLKLWNWKKDWGFIIESDERGHNATNNPQGGRGLNFLTRTESGGTITDTSRLFISTNGNIGFENPAPSFKLHGKAEVANTWTSKFENTSNGSNIHFAHGGGYGLHVNGGTNAVANTYLLELASSNNLGDYTKLKVSGDGAIRANAKKAAWGYIFSNKQNGSNFHAANGGGYGIHINGGTNATANTYLLEIASANNLGDYTKLIIKGDGALRANAKKVDWGYIFSNKQNGSNFHAANGRGYGIHVNGGTNANANTYLLELASANGLGADSKLKVSGNGNLNTIGIITGKNTKPIKNQMVHRRIIYGLAGDPRLAFGRSSTVVRNTIYQPFGYALPALQEGATRKYRLYAIYSDSMQQSGIVAVNFNPDGGSAVQFQLPRTWGSTGEYNRDGFSNWRTAAAFSGFNGKHGKVYIFTSVNGTNGVLHYMELQAWDFF